MKDFDQIDEIDEKEELFFDTVNEFLFYDYDVTDQSNDPTPDSTLSESSPEVSPPASALPFHSSSCHGIFPSESKQSNPESSSISSDITQTDDSKTRYGAERYEIYRDLKENEKNLEIDELTRWDQDGVDSVGDTNNVSKDDKTESIEKNELGDSSSSNLFVFIAELVIKTIGFQVNLLIKFVNFPIWALCNSNMLVVDPSGVMGHARGCFVQNLECLWNLICGFVSPFLGDWFKDPQAMWNLLLRCGYASFWSFYVCIVLCGLLVFSIMASGVLTSYLVENPIEMEEELNFDYTQKSPVAYVPVMSCGGVGCGITCEERNLGPRFIPPYHKLQVDVKLTLPESEYNRNLGIFQIRADFLSADGKTLASKRQPCMLKFQSEPIRSLLTFFKFATLITGYASESQTIKLKIRGINEGDVPISCIKVILEQRAEYQPGGGIPQIYGASLRLETELPFFKSIIWSWKKTIFVWISMMLFIIELLFTLICCRPGIIPQRRQREDPAVNNLMLQYLTGQS